MHSKNYRRDLKIGIPFQILPGLTFLVWLIWEQEQLLYLLHLNTNCAIWAMFNVFFYIAFALRLTYQLYNISQENYRAFRSQNNVYSLFILIFAFWGMSQIFNTKMEILSERHPEQLANIYRALIFMACMRMVPLALMTIIAIFSFLYVCAHLAIGRRQVSEINEARLSRLPGVKSFLKNRSRLFKKETDGNLESCAICIENYAEGTPRHSKEIVELSCKHTFHV